VVVKKNPQPSPGVKQEKGTWCMTDTSTNKGGCQVSILAQLQEARFGDKVIVAWSNAHYFIVDPGALAADTPEQIRDTMTAEKLRGCLTKEMEGFYKQLLVEKGLSR